MRLYNISITRTGPAPKVKDLIIYTMMCIIVLVYNCVCVNKHGAYTRVYSRVRFAPCYKSSNLSVTPRRTADNVFRAHTYTLFCRDLHILWYYNNAFLINALDKTDIIYIYYNMYRGERERSRPALFFLRRTRSEKPVERRRARARTSHEDLQYAHVSCSYYYYYDYIIFTLPV